MCDKILTSQHCETKLGEPTKRLIGSGCVCCESLAPKEKNSACTYYAKLSNDGIIHNRCFGAVQADVWLAVTLIHPLIAHAYTAAAICYPHYRRQSRAITNVSLQWSTTAVFLTWTSKEQ